MSQFVFLIFFTIWVFDSLFWAFDFCHNSSYEFCPYLSFCVVSQFQFFSFLVLSQFEFLSFLKIWFFELCHNLSFVTIWVFEFCFNLSFWVFSQFGFSHNFYSFYSYSFIVFIVLWQFEFFNSKILFVLVLSHLSFWLVTFRFFFAFSHFEFLSFVTIWVFNIFF